MSTGVLVEASERNWEVGISGLLSVYFRSGSRKTHRSTSNPTTQAKPKAVALTADGGMMPISFDPENAVNPASNPT